MSTSERLGNKQPQYLPQFYLHYRNDHSLDILGTILLSTTLLDHWSTGSTQSSTTMAVPTAVCLFIYSEAGVLSGIRLYYSCHTNVGNFIVTVETTFFYFKNCLTAILNPHYHKSCSCSVRISWQKHVEFDFTKRRPTPRPVWNRSYLQLVWIELYMNGNNLSKCCLVHLRFPTGTICSQSTYSAKAPLLNDGSVSHYWQPRHVTVTGAWLGEGHARGMPLASVHVP